MTYSLHRGAELDLIEAAHFYRREGGAKLANRFLKEFERVVEMLILFPGVGTSAEEVRRTHPLQDFPYSVIYRDGGRHIRVLVVRGQLRDPEHGESRWSFAGALSASFPRKATHSEAQHYRGERHEG